MTMNAPVDKSGAQSGAGASSSATSAKVNAEDVLGGGKRARGGRANGFVVFGAFVIFLLVIAAQGTLVDAKRGCANFGHSCYGGMGKRANSLNEEYASQEGNSVEGEVDPALVFTGPRSVLRPLTAQRILREKLMEDKMASDDKMDKMARLSDLQSRDALKLYLKQFLKLYHNNPREDQRNNPEQ